MELEYMAMKPLWKGRGRNSLWILYVWKGKIRQVHYFYTYLSYIAAGHIGCVNVLWYKYASKESAGNLVLVAVLCKYTVR